MKGMSLTAGALLLALGLLAGCAETQLAVHNMKTLEDEEPTAGTPTQMGAYKVGKPYAIANVWYYPREEFDYDETGIASWYGPGFHGKYTANGELYDQDAMTAAHRTLPMPSLVQVTNLENGRAIRVRINDRGPFAHGRIIDLSKRAADLHGFINQGTAKVRVQILEVESRELAMLASGGTAGTAVRRRRRCRWRTSPCRNCRLPAAAHGPRRCRRAVRRRAATPRRSVRCSSRHRWCRRTP
jgi:rare lipoprotein A